MLIRLETDTRPIMIQLQNDRGESVEYKSVRTFSANDDPGTVFEVTIVIPSVNDSNHKNTPTLKLANE